MRTQTLVAALIGAIFASVACGRSPLDFSVDEEDVNGAAGTTSPASAGAGGSASGMAGTSAVAGTGGGAGTSGGAAGTGRAGTTGGTGRDAGTDADARDAAPDRPLPDAVLERPGDVPTLEVGPVACTSGASECVGMTRLRICVDSRWGAPIDCPLACIKAVCAECVPGTTEVGPDGQTRKCSPDGIWSSFTGCPGPDINGVCVDCKPGQTRCASHEAVQTCTPAGAWGSATPCEFVCVVDACGRKPKRVFVTSTLYKGGLLGGLDGADKRCQERALAANLGGTYRAWLSDFTGSPSTRFTRDGGPYQLVTGSVISNKWTTLVSAPLRHAIDRTELAGPPPASTGGCDGPLVWSDTKGDGTLNEPGLTCGDWTDPDGSASAWGLATAQDSWTEYCTGGNGPANGCSAQAALYCFEQ